MAIARDATSEGSTGSGTSLTVSHTITGSDTLLLVHVLTNNTVDNITGVTYNSVAMTKLITQTDSSSPSSYGYVFGLIAPASGVHDIVVTFSVASLIGMQAVSYTGVSQSGFPDAQSSGNGSGNPIGTSWTASITTIADNCWHFLGIRTDTISSVGTGGTRVLSANFGGVQTTFDSNAAITPAGNHDITGSCANANQSYKMSVSFAPVGATATSFLPILGVGT